MAEALAMHPAAARGMHRITALGSYAEIFRSSDSDDDDALPDPSAL
jgi:hypothetical protein